MPTALRVTAFEARGDELDFRYGYGDYYYRDDGYHSSHDTCSYTVQYRKRSMVTFWEGLGWMTQEIELRLPDKMHSLFLELRRLIQLF